MLINKSIIKDNAANDLRISSVLNYENKVDFHNFSAKYVISGDELYFLNNKTYKVSSGQYVVGNKHTMASVVVDSATPVKGICVDVSENIISEIIDFTFKKNQAFKDFIFNQEWMVNKYNASNTNLGYALNLIAQKYEDTITGHTTFSNEIFYSVAECIVKDQEQIFKQFHSLKAVKDETNGRLFNFIYDAKNYMDAHYLDNINLEEIALESKLSQYHFIRLFKQVFKITPYQYILKKRLEYAKMQLIEGVTIMDITYQTGFSNPANFSKAFKKQFGKSPKNFLA